MFKFFKNRRLDKALKAIEKKHGVSFEQIDALNCRYDLDANELTWHLVHEALLIALSAEPKTVGIPTELVRSFARQLRQATSECEIMTPKSNETVIALNATGLTWRYVYGRLLVALMHPEATGESADIVRSFADKLGLALVEWTCLTPKELKEERKEWDLFRQFLLAAEARRKLGQ